MVVSILNTQKIIGLETSTYPLIAIALPIDSHKLLLQTPAV